MESIGLHIDDDTRDAMRSALEWNKRIEQVLNGLIIAIIMGAVSALLGFFGVKLPPAGGG